jgi:hypothetical protein
VFLRFLRRLNGIRIAHFVKTLNMKKAFLILCLPVALLTFSECATKDTKNEVENYPTYDTTQKMETINDTISDEGAYGEGEDRHNVNDK